MWRFARVAFAAVSLAVFASPTLATASPVATDPATQGPFTAVASEYKLSASIDAEVTSAIATELWARVFYPKGPNVPNTLPLVIMLHGEHGTCGHLDPTNKWYIDDNAQYTFSGTCPTGYRVTPNHWGYDYIGSLLASNGYLVVSINTNRGINQAPEVPAESDPGNIQRRGRMILRHLQQLGVWASNGGTPKSVGFEFKGRIDFSRITLVGHSRGAEAIASANLLLNDNGSPWPARLPANTKLLGLAAIAPSDYQTSANPGSTYGLPYAVLLPMCDGDVARLSGIHYYDMSVGFALDTPGHFKASFATWGADHDGYNTEWQTQDGYDFAKDVPNKQNCPGQPTKLFPSLGTSDDQQQIGRRFVMAMVRGATEAPAYAQLLDPAYSLPTSITSITRYDRGFFPGQTAGHGKRLMQFAGNGNCKTELFTTVGTVGSCGRAPEHDESLTWISRIRWGTPAGSTPTDSNFAHFVFNAGAAFDLTKSKTVEFRIGPDCVLVQPSNGKTTDYGCSKPSLQAPGSTGAQTIYALLADKNSNFTQYVAIGNYTDPRQAVGLDEVPDSQTLINPLYHALMSSVRVPIADFKAASPFDMTNVQSIWFYLGYKGSSGGLFVGDIIATDAPVTKIADPLPPMASNRIGVPLPPRSAASLRPSDDEVTADVGATVPTPVRTPAAPGNEIVAIHPAAVTSLPGLAREPMVDLTLKTPKTMIAADGGFHVLVGGVTADARHVGTSGQNLTLTTLSVPQAVLDSAAATGLSIVSGGSRWDFGPPPSISPR
jgi:hypothetical protein